MRKLSEIRKTMKYPIGIQDFGKIRRDGYAYVDKTALMYKMVSEGSYYFLSRPRRFGKSLFLSTLEAYFNGEKELFEGLDVSLLETEWTKHPILHLDLNSREYKDETSLKAELNRHLEGWEKIYGDEYQDRAIFPEYPLCFFPSIGFLCRGRKTHH